MIKAFIFDIGDVLLEVDYDSAVHKLLAGRTVDREALETTIHTAKVALESGHIDNAEFSKQVMAALEFGGSQREFARIWCDIFAIKPDSAALVAALKPNYPLYLLSNTSGLHIDFVNREFALFSQFDDAVYSHHAGCMKPDPSIYQQALEKFAVLPAETVFIDDLPANIATARNLGFQTFHYAASRHTVLLEWLGELGVKL